MAQLRTVSDTLRGRPTLEGAWRGPIVMTTQDEVQTAFRELETGAFVKVNI